MIRNYFINSMYVLYVLFGFSLLVLVHELGHFLVGMYYNFKIISLNIGFGLNIFNIEINDIIYKINLIPLGGYVEFRDDVFLLNNNNYLQIIQVFVAGPIASIILGYLLLKVKIKYFFNDIGFDSDSIEKEVSGPIKAFKMMFDNSKNSTGKFLETLAIISLSIGIFNLLPFYPLDGGKILEITLEYFNININLIKAINTLGIVLIFILMLYVFYNDIKYYLDGNDNKQDGIITQIEKDIYVLCAHKCINDLKFIGYNIDQIKNTTIVQDYLYQLKFKDRIDYLKLNNNYLTFDLKLSKFSLYLLGEYYRDN